MALLLKSRWGLGAALVCASMWLGVGPRAAVAQWSYEGEVRWQNGVTRAVFLDFIETCRLDEFQEQEARPLFAKHLKRFGAFAAEGKAIESALEAAYKQEELGSLRWHERKQAADIKSGEFADEQAALMQRVLREFRSLLSEWQHPLWDSFIHKVHRQWWLPRSHRFYEERVDLFAIVREMELADDDMVEPAAFRQVLSSYDRALDEALVRRHELQVAWARGDWKRTAVRIQTDGERVWLGPHPDPDWRKKDLEEQKKRGRAHKAVRDVNHRYRDQLAATLAPTRLAEFFGLYQRQSNPAAYSPGSMPGLKYLLQVERHESLSADQQDAVAAIRAGYEAAAEPLNHRVAKASDRWMKARLECEPLERRLPLRAKYWKAVHQRYDLEDRLVDQIWAVLTPQQRELLRKPEPLDREAWK